MQVRLYTRRGCCLCDVALATLHEHGLQVDEIDIDSDAELCAQFTTCVPVVEIDGRIRFRGRVEPLLLRRLIAQEHS